MPNSIPISWFYIILNRLIGLVSWEFNPRSRHTKDLKMVLDTSLLNTQHYKVRIKGEVEQSRERSSYWKGSRRVALDHSRQLYLFIWEFFVPALANGIPLECE